MKRKNTNATQAILEDLLRFALRESGIVHHSPYLVRFRKEIKGLAAPPDPHFLAEVEAAKGEIAKQNDYLRLHAVNGMISVDHVMVVMEKVIQHNSRFRNSQAN